MKKVSEFLWKPDLLGAYKPCKKYSSGKDVKVIASNNKRKNAVDAYKQALAELFACGVDVTVLPSQKAPGHSENTVRVPEKAVEESSGFKAEIKIPVQANAEPSKPSGKESLVYSGVSAGLPAPLRKRFPMTILICFLKERT